MSQKLPSPSPRSRRPAPPPTPPRRRDRGESALETPVLPLEVDCYVAIGGPADQMVICLTEGSVNSAYIETKEWRGRYVLEETKVALRRPDGREYASVLVWVPKP